MRGYYYLLSGLPEIKADDSRLSYTVQSFKEEIYPDLHEDDKKLVRLFYLKYDNANFLKVLVDKDADPDGLGFHRKEDFTQLIEAVRGGDAAITKLPPYFEAFLRDYFNDEANASVHEFYEMQDKLSSYYYAYALRAKNEFVAAWFELNLNVNNLLAAYTARRYKLDVAKAVVGDTSVCAALRSSSMRDFGLSFDLDYVDEVARLSEIPDLVEREKRVDQLKWKWLDENTCFKYFSIENIFSFLMKTEMIERWLTLDKDSGNKTFRSLIDGLKKEVEVPEEFKQ